MRLNPLRVDMTDNDVINDVTTGKVDVGLVFKTEALNAGDDVSWFAFPESADATVTSWIAPLKDSVQAELAKRFVQDATGVAARKIFTDAGFAEPNEKFEG
jgi:molybdate transport system substrate-binding protein